MREIFGEGLLDIVVGKEASCVSMSKFRRICRSHDGDEFKAKESSESYCQSHAGERKTILCVISE